MAEEEKKEEKFDFTADGEAIGYISLAQARLLAMQAARETPGDYGDRYGRFSGVSMVFTLMADDEDDDYYTVLLDIRPSGRFDGTPGREQFFISKEGEVALRQVLTLPRAKTRWRLPLIIAGGALVSMVALNVFGSGSPTEVPVEVVVEREVIKEVPVEVIVEREVIKEVPVEKEVIVEREVIKEVFVEKEVIRNFIVIATPPPPTSVFMDAESPSGNVVFRDHYYLAVPQRMTWVEAAAYSEALGGYLVTINDADENRIVTDLSRTMNDGQIPFWIGLTGEEQEGVFLWVTGKSVDYTNWSGGEPNNYNGDEDYVAIGKVSPDGWNDHASKDNQPFVVEFETFAAASTATPPTDIPILNTDANIFYGSGVKLYEDGFFESARFQFALAIMGNNEFVNAYWFRAVTNEKLGQNELAIVDYDQAIRLAPQIAELYRNRGVVRANLGQSQQAKADLDKACLLDKDYC